MTELNRYEKLALRLAKPQDDLTVEKQAFHIVESGGKQFNDDGSVVTSPKGAIGRAQVMPGTGPEAASLAGVPWDRYRFKFDAEYNTLIGDAYFEQKVKDFNGDIKKGHAAYNAGTRRVQEAIDTANKMGGSWEQYLPPETQNHLIKMDNAKENIQKTSLETSGLNRYEKLALRLGKSKDSDVVVPSGPYKKQSEVGTFVSHAVEGAVPALGFVAGGSRAAALAAPLAAAVGVPTGGIGAAVVEASAFLAGGLASSFTAREIQDFFLPSEAKKYLLKGEKDNRYWAVGGEIASFVPLSKFGLPYKLLPTGEKVLNKPAVVTLAGLGGAADAGMQYAQTGDVDLGQVAMNTIATPFMSGALSKVGKAVSVTKRETLDQNVIDFANGTQNEIEYNNYLAHKLGASIRVVTKGNEFQQQELFHSLGRDAKTGGKARSNIMTDVDMAAQKAGLTAKFNSLVRDSALNMADPNHPSHVNKVKVGSVLEKLEKLGSTEHLIKPLQDLRNILDDIGIKARDAGVLKGLRRHYVSSIIDRTKSQLSDEGVAKVIQDFYKARVPGAKSKFTEARAFETAQELQDYLTASGSGLFVKTNAADVMTIYLSSMNKAITEKHFVDTLRSTTLDQASLGNAPLPVPVVKGKPKAKTSVAVRIGEALEARKARFAKPLATATEKGLAIAAKRRAKQEAAAQVADPKLTVITDDISVAYKNKYVPYKGQGSEALKGMFVHPEFTGVVDHLFKQVESGKVKNALFQSAMLVKAFNVVGSLFHVPSLGWAMAGASPSLAFKEIITGGSGIRRAVKNLRQGTSGEYVDLAIRSGTKVGTEDIKRTIVADFGAWVDSGLGFRATQYLTHPVDKYILQKLNTFTWDYMHTGGKLALFEHLMKNSEKHITIPKFGADGVTISPAWNQVRERLAMEVSTSVNATMGGQQWLQAANAIKGKVAKQMYIHGTGINSRAWAQVALFAPDWTASTIQAFTMGLPKEMLKPGHWDVKGGLKGIAKPMTAADLSRRYAIHTGLLWLTLLNGINLATSGQFIWENDDPTRIQHKDGTTQQLAKHSMEIVHWLMDPIKTLRNKLGFAPKAALALLDDRAGGAVERAGNIGKLVLPFAAGSAMQAPKGEGLSRGLWSSLGFPIYGKPDAWLRDIEDVLAEKEERRNKRYDRLLEEVELEQRKAERASWF